MKLTFIGDIMIEPPVLKAAKQPDGTYDFYGVFAQCQKLFDEADFLVGNLETPLAGDKVPYTQHFYAFNAPDAYADAIKKTGFDMVSTANNHIYDRGYEGEERTIRVLDEKGIGHHGTFLPGGDHPEAFYKEVNGLKIAVVAYTYSTNYSYSGGTYLSEGKYAGTVNLLRPQTESVYQPGVFRGPDWVDKVFFFLDKERAGRIKKVLGMDYNYPRADDRLNKKTMQPYVDAFQADIRKAKEKADLVIFYPHMGGQFNPFPGAISEYAMDKALEAGADAVMASHSHMLQKAELREGIPCAYSLGNFNMARLSSLVMDDYLPYFGIAVHMYVEDKKIVRTTFSILKADQKRGKPIRTWPVDELYAAMPDGKEKDQLLIDVKKAYEMVAQKPLEGDIIRREYELEAI